MSAAPTLVSKFSPEAHFAWLDSQCLSELTLLHVICGVNYGLIELRLGELIVYGKTIREAIDLAMQAQGAEAC